MGSFRMRGAIRVMAGQPRYGKCRGFVRESCVGSKCFGLTCTPIHVGRLAAVRFRCGRVCHGLTTER